MGVCTGRVKHHTRIDPRTHRFAGSVLPLIDRLGQGQSTPALTTGEMLSPMAPPNAGQSYLARCFSLSPLAIGAFTPVFDGLWRGSGEGAFPQAQACDSEPAESPLTGNLREERKFRPPERQSKDPASGER